MSAGEYRLRPVPALVQLPVQRGDLLSGHLREDFVPEDLVILLMANAGVIAATGEAAPDTWRRLVGHMLRSYAAPGTELPPLPQAPTPTAIYRAMVRLARTGEEA